MFECLGGCDFSLTLGSYMKLGGSFELLLVKDVEVGENILEMWLVEVLFWLNGRREVI